MAGTIVNSVGGIFLQDTWQPFKNTRIEGGMRVDYHNRYGAFALPRLAIFHRFDQHWVTHGGFGLGYKIPNPLTPQIRDYDINQIHGIQDGAVSERSFGASLEGAYQTNRGDDHSLFINHAFFITRLDNPYMGYEQADGSLAFSNANRPITTKGFDTYIRLKLTAWEVYLGYTYTEAEREYLYENRFVPIRVTALQALWL